MVNNMECPGCGNTDGNEFERIKGEFMTQLNEPYSYPSEVSLYVCKKCGAIRASNSYSFGNKSDIKKERRLYYVKI